MSVSRHVGLGVLALVGLALLLHTGRVTAHQPGNTVIVKQLAAGTLLVAARNLPDPNFADTVVLLIDYSADGAAGVVLNRPAGLPVSRAVPHLDVLAGVMAPAFVGGPVSGDSVIAIARDGCDSCQTVARDVHLMKDAQALKRRLFEGTDERRLRVYVGYAGWTGGQLEREVRQGVWRVLPGEARVVFDAEPATLWRRLRERAEAVMALGPASILKRVPEVRPSGACYAPS